MKSVFFYGLFMDKDLLQQKGFCPQNIKPACLQGYQLKIGERATLTPLEGARSYGTVMDLDDSELRDLYGSDGVEDYVPQTVQATTMLGATIEVVCYILPVEKISGSNSGYAIKLASIAKKLEFPRDYIEEIQAWS